MTPLARALFGWPDRKIAAAALFVCVLGGAWLLYTFPPESTRFYPQCAFKRATGYDCPGCGTTRALHALLHGRIEEAFRFNPMLFVLFGVALFALPALARGETPRFLNARWFRWTALVALFGWWVLRNV